MAHQEKYRHFSDKADTRFYFQPHKIETNNGMAVMPFHPISSHSKLTPDVCVNLDQIEFD